MKNTKKQNFHEIRRETTRHLFAESGEQGEEEEEVRGDAEPRQRHLVGGGREERDAGGTGEEATVV